MVGPDCSVVPSDGIGDRRLKSKHRKCNLNIRKTFCTLSVIEHWNRLDSPYLEMFKTCLELSCATCSGQAYFSRVVGLDDFQRSLPTPTILGFV